MIPILCLLMSELAWGQGRISGHIYSEKGEAVSFANVLIFQASDSSFVKGDISNANGEFDISHTLNSEFYLRISSVGYLDFNSQIFRPQDELDMGIIEMQSNTTLLAEIEIQSKKPLYEKKIDRTIVNVNSSVTNAGNTVLNVLGKSPNIQIDRTTNQINMMGKQGVVVMIDNKQVRMENADLISLLESMSSDNIETIELITSPPASYDAQGNAGIVNIITAAKTKEGFLGQFSANLGYGERPKFGGSMNLSYTKNKIYAFANLSTNHNYSPENVSLFTDFTFPNQQRISDLNIKRLPYVGLHTAEIGLDYEFSDNTTVGLLFSISYRDWEMDATADTDLTTEIDGDFNQFVTSLEENKLLRTLANLNLRHTFSESTNLSFDYDNIQFNRENPTTYHTTSSSNQVELSKGEFISYGETPLEIHVLKTDFQHSLSGKLSFEAGLKSTFSSFTNDASISNLIDDNYEKNEAFSDVFRMTEEIYAGYFSLDWKISPQLLLKSGLRFEHYDLDLKSDKLTTILDRSTSRFYPSIYLNYKPNDDYEFNTAFVRRIERPGFLILAPAFYFFDQNTLFTGNPNIIPTNSNQLKFDFRYKSLNTAIDLTDFQNPVFNWQPNLDEELELFVIQPQQARKNQMVTISASLPIDISKWWTSRYSLIGFHRRQFPMVEGREITTITNNFTFNTTQNFSFKNDMELEINGMYNSAFYYGVLRVDPRYELNLGLRKKFKTGTSLSININDVFNSSSQWHFGANLPDSRMFYDWSINNEGPIFRINLTMPIGNQKLEERKKRNSGSSEEQQRLN